MPELTAHTFLTTLYPEDAPGVVSLFVLPAKKLLARPVAQIRKLLEQAKSYLGTQNIYFGLGLLRQMPRSGRGQEDHVIAIPGLWVDLDVASPVHQARNLPPTVDAILSVMEQACPSPPSVIMHSGHGLQAYWLFKELWIVNDAEERSQAKHLCQRLQACIQAAAQAHGWHVDSTFDLTRIFRLPATINRKADPVPVTCLTWEPERRYNPSDFDAWLPPAPEQTPAQETHPPAGMQTLPLSARLKYLLRVGEDPDDPDRYASRSEATFAVMTGLVHAGWPDDQITAVMLDPAYALTAKCREQGERWVRQEVARVRNKHPPAHAATWRRERQEPTTSPLCDPFAFTDAAAILASPRQERRWLIPGIIAEGLTLLGGSPKGGKTYLAYALALAVATDGVWCGHWRTEAGKVLYISLEDDANDSHLRMDELMPHAPLRPGQLIFLHGAESLPSFGDGLIAWMGEAMAMHAPRLIIIDPISYLYVLKKNGNQFEETKDMLVPLRELGKTHHCAMVCLDHRRKRSRDDVLMVDTLYGSVAKQAVADGIIMVNRDHEDIELEMTIRHGQEQKIYIKFTFDGGRCFLQYTGGAPENNNYGDLRTRLLDALRRAPAPLTTNDLIHELELTDSRQMHKNLSLILYRATKAREVEKLSRGRFIIGEGE